VTIPPYRYVLEEKAFEAFILLPDDDADLVRSFFRWLASHPHDTGRGFHADATGRPNYASLCGPILIVHWTDHGAREVRVVSLLPD
jgi:hypothetical protein